MEGFLPARHALGWSAVAVPCVALGLRTLKRKVRRNPEFKLLLGVAAAFSLVLSALKLPSVTGSSSHPTGTGFGAVLFGPMAMAPIAAVVLFFQALLLAHGGITTLGANIVSMGVVGPAVACAWYQGGRLCRFPQSFNLFLAVSCADLATYLTTSFQLALAFPDPLGGYAASFAKFAGIFALTQIPLAVAEGMVSVLVFNALARHNRCELTELGLPLARQE